MPLTNYLIEQFIARCRIAYDTCELSKELLKNRNKAFFENPLNDILFGTINNIAIEHGLLQISKLHDSSQQRGNKNLSIQYVIEHGNWENGVKEELTQLYLEMQKFYAYIKPARNRALCHNDVQSIELKEVVGSFKEGEDEIYFQKLEAFIGIITRETYKEDFQFNTYMKECISNLTTDS